MFGLSYYKADASTYAIKTVNGKAQQQGRGLSFFYNTAKVNLAFTLIGKALLCAGIARQRPNFFTCSCFALSG